MKQRTADTQRQARSAGPSGTNGRHRRANGEARKDAAILGLHAFEQISAVEGIRLSDEMRRDLQSLDAGNMDEGERSRFIIGKYGKP